MFKYNKMEIQFILAIAISLFESNALIPDMLLEAIYLFFIVMCV